MLAITLVLNTQSNATALDSVVRAKLCQGWCPLLPSGLPESLHRTQTCRPCKLTRSFYLGVGSVCPPHGTLSRHTSVVVRVTVLLSPWTWGLPHFGCPLQLLFQLHQYRLSLVSMERCFLPLKLLSRIRVVLGQKRVTQFWPEQSWVDYVRAPVDPPLSVPSYLDSFLNSAFSHGTHSTQCLASSFRSFLVAEVSLPGNHFSWPASFPPAS